MKLIDDFYHITNVDHADGQLSCKVAMNAGHSIYGVHFPGNPVTPGVCLLQMAKEIVEREYDKRLKLGTAVNIRFKNPVLPADTPTFEYSKIAFDEQEGVVRLTIRDDARQFATMFLRYKILR